jgi:hypothetical protein
VNRRIRRGLVIAGVIASLVVGVASIRVAAELAAAAAPPPAPPVSMQALQAALTAEQARAGSLQQQLDDLLGATGQLTSAIDSTETQVSADGSSAAQLRARLKAAEARLVLLTKLLKAASARLAQLGVAGPTVPPTSKPPVSGGGTTPAATPRPTPKPTSASTGFSLTVALGGGGVVARWTTCGASSFSAYALVRSLDSEIHYPPEDLDTVIATITSNSTTSATDAAAPTGRLYYRVYCLTNAGGETRTSATTPTASITVP